MSIKIVFPDYPVRVQMSKSRRKKYYMLDEDKPKKYSEGRYMYKDRKLYDIVTKEFLVRNAGSLDKPRFLPLSYNKISTRQKVPALIKLKEYMKEHIPDDLVIPLPMMLDCTVYDFVIPIHKDLDNMHIYTKAFLDLLVNMGFIPDDSKQYVTQAGGFRYTPVAYKFERKLVFSIKQDFRKNIVEHLMYNIRPREVSRNGKNGFHIKSTNESIPGEISIKDDQILCNFGSIKIVKVYANKIFKQIYYHCMNHNSGCWVNQDFYRIHTDRIQKELLQKGVPVSINI